MGLFSRKTAETLDNAASTLYSAGTKVGGKKGGRAGDAVANAVIAPIRSRINESCTNCDKGKCKTH